MKRREFSITRGRSTVKKLIEVDSQVGLAERVILSKKCYDNIWKLSNNFKLRNVSIQFYYKPNKTRDRIVIILEGPIQEGNFANCYRLNRLKHDNINYSAGDNSSEQFFSYEGEKEQ